MIMVTMSLLLGLAISMVSGPARGDLILNEIRTKGFTKTVEILNTGPDSVNLLDYGVRSSMGTVEPLGFTMLPPGDIITITLDVRTRGDCIELFDSSDDLEVVKDVLNFGDTGGGPHDILAVPTSTIARFDETPDPAGEFSAERWTIDFTGTLGDPNDATPVTLGDSLIINEVIGTDWLVELHNRESFAISVNGWLVTSGQNFVVLPNETIGPGSFQIFDIFPLEFEFSLNAYLVAHDSVRVDQIGLSDAPGVWTTWQNAVLSGQSFQRVPDGAGPNNGYDLESSGFPDQLQICFPTPGWENCTINSVAEGAPAPLMVRELRSNPNPFNPSTTILYTLERASHVELAIFDIAGRRVATLVDGRLPAGEHRSRWDGTGVATDGASGVYFIRLDAAGSQRTIKTVLAR
jgi:hypothetical protein